MALTALAVVDGTVMPADEATIGVTDLGLLRGDGVFEVISVYEGQPFALEDHLRRMATSAQNLRLEIDLAAVQAELQALLDAAGPVTGAVRFLVTRGGRRIGLVEAVPEQRDPITLAAVEYVPPRVLDGVKSLSYAGNMLAQRLAAERGAGEALLVTPHGRVLEAPTSSIFCVDGAGELWTPPLEEHILASITRQRVMALTEVRECPATTDDMLGAREAFLASTLREVGPVAAIEDRELDAPGERTAEAAALLREDIRASLG
jgi:branched-chain amino acid aminotransferase